MRDNETRPDAGTEPYCNAPLIESNLGIDFHALVRFGFMEQSARYLGVYFNNDRYQAMDDERNIIN
ncbi:MAG: hypothetical protein OEY43_06730 [Gammaproteobacteria bacterium]|nr:hypothetical protein [Gammaproteobacteria bacterium]